MTEKLKRGSKPGNAQKLLTEYRPTVWRKLALEAVPGVALDEVRVCSEQIRFTQGLVETLRNNRRVGEKLYWIILITYLSERQPSNIEETLSEIADNYGYIPRRTYFRLRRYAIEMLDRCLAGMATGNVCGGNKSMIEPK